MRWKLWVVLFCAVAVLDRTIPVKAESEDDVIEDTAVESASETVEDETEPVTQDEKPAESESVNGVDDDDDGEDNEDTRVDEDAVEVDPQAAAKAEGKKGRYLNYDYYSSNLDTYDVNYNWEGKHS